MRKLILTPQKDFSAALPTGALAAVQDSPAAAYAALPPNQPAQVDVRWVCSPGEYTYLRAFHRLVGGGSLPFLIDLVLDGGDLMEYRARFVPGSLRLDRAEGNLRSCRASLEVALADPSTVGPDADAALVASYGAA